MSEEEFKKDVSDDEEVVIVDTKKKDRVGTPLKELGNFGVTAEGYAWKSSDSLNLAIVVGSHEAHIADAIEDTWAKVVDDFNEVWQAPEPQPLRVHTRKFLFSRETQFLSFITFPFEIQ
jgi:hypothetical protein